MNRDKERLSLLEKTLRLVVLRLREHIDKNGLRREDTYALRAHDIAFKVLPRHIQKQLIGEK